MYEHVSMNADHFARLPEYRPNSRFIYCVLLKRFICAAAHNPRFFRRFFPYS